MPLTSCCTSEYFAGKRKECDDELTVNVLYNEFKQRSLDAEEPEKKHTEFEQQSSDAGTPDTQSVQQPSMHAINVVVHDSSPENASSSRHLLAAPIFGDARDARGTSELSLKQRRLLVRQATSAAKGEKLASDARAAGEQAGHGHGHGSRKPSFVTSIISALINFLLMFGLCCAYGMIMFSDGFNSRHRALGVKMNLGCALIMGLVVALLSKVRVGIGGPDLNPVVFFAAFVEKMAPEIATQSNLEYPVGRRLAASSSDAVEFCTGAHFYSNQDECLDYHDQLRATTIFAAFVSSALLGLIFFILGRAKLTQYVSMVPTSVQEAFLSCIGYKVFKYALKFSNYDMLQFVPAAAVGVPLYFMKALHIGNPAIVMPCGILVPLLIFWVIMYSTGYDTAGDPQGLFFPDIQDVPFWHIWSDSLGKVGSINFSAWTTTLADLSIMLIVVLLDCSLKISSTEAKLPVKVDKDYEISLFGAANALVAFSGSTVGYMQLKFNVINYGVIGNVVDNRAGIMYAVLCGGAFFGNIEFFNYLPRFFLSAMLFFAGTGFVCENLWGSRQYLSFSEWFEILIIVGVFIITGQLLPAVFVGFLLAFISFLVRYSRISAVAGKPLTGANISMQHKVGEQAIYTLKHISDSWLLAVRLKGYIFFGSVKGVASMVAEQIESQMENNVPSYRRLRFVIFDCQQLDGIEASAAKTLKKLSEEAKDGGVTIIYSSVSDRLAMEMETRGILLSKDEVFFDMASAVFYVETLVIKYATCMEGLFASLHPAIQFTKDTCRAQTDFEPFSAIFTTDAARLGCPWCYCTSTRIKKYSTVLWNTGDKHAMLYLVSSGAVGVFAKDVNSDDDNCSSPIAIYRHGQFLNLEMLASREAVGSGIALESGELISWSREEWRRMSRERPVMAARILEAAMSQSQNEKSSQESVPSEKCSKVNMPESVSNRLGRLRTAHALDQLGLFKPPGTGDPGLLPALPELLRLDAAVAFRTYTDFQGEELLRPEDVGKALMFAGIFGTQLAVDQLQHLDEASFLSIAHEAYMARFDTQQVSIVQELFQRFDADNSGVLEVGELVLVLQHITQDEFIDPSLIDGLASAWKGAAKVDTFGKLLIDSKTFISIMSRFVKSHMIDWCLLHAIIDITGAGGSIQGADVEHLFGAELPVEEVAALIEASKARPGVAEHREWLARSYTTCLEEKNRHQVSSMELAEELVWASDWSGKGKVGSPAIVTAAMPLDPSPHEHSFLPPKPKKAAFINPPAEASGLDAKASGLDAKALSQAVLDLRDPDKRAVVLQACQQNAVRHFVDFTPGLSQSTLVDIDEETPEGNDQKHTSIKLLLYDILEEPKSSKLAEAWYWSICTLIILSTLSLIAEPLLEKMKANSFSDWNPISEWIFTIVFTLELVARFAVCDAKGGSRFRFWLDPSNIGDLVAIIPGYVEAIVHMHTQELRLLRIVRLARMARLTRLQRLFRHAAPITMVLLVIWGIFLQKEHKK